ncbi:serine/threonine-protein kinase nek [Anaeramoeba flamelloides]|uniref:non-specific serine/threonine protein kinase n=1 Tax=Anaeramoeba flamelloides TaxID=1746091 RepID=A0ABQ8ZD88_9EUKA|nr:serine/threonine-protein kinase nek [Anaeramoeba flamelloides]
MNPSLHIPNYTIGQQLKTTKKWKSFLVQHKATNHFVKVIEIHKSTTDLNQKTKRLLNHIDQIKRFDHPNFVRLLQKYEDPKRYCLITDHFEGTTLREFLKTNGRIESKLDLNKILIQLISIIKYFHSNEFTHGNINPDLILINKNLNIKLKTFGFLTGREKKFTNEEINDSFSDHFTNESICEHFIAPELMTIQPEISKKNDLYSLGICILFMILDQKQFNNFFECNQKYQNLNKIILPKWVGKKLTILIKQMIQINQKNRIYITDQKFLQFCNDLGFDKIDFMKEIKDIGNGSESRKIYYEPKIILRMELLLNSNKKTIIKSLVKEKLDYNNAVYRLLNHKHIVENLSFTDEEYEKVNEIIKHTETNLKLQANNTTTSTKYNSQNDGENNINDDNDNESPMDLKINVTTNDEMIFDNRDDHYNDIKYDDDDDLKNSTKKSKEHFNNMKTVIKTEKKQNREELYQILQNMEKSKSVNKSPKKPRKNRLNKNKNLSNNVANTLNNTQSNDKKLINKQENQRKRSPQRLKKKCTFSKNDEIQPIMKTIQKKHKSYLNDILSSEKDKLEKKFSPMQIKRIKKRNNIKKNSKNYNNRRMNIFNMYTNDKKCRKNTISSNNNFQKSSRSAGKLIFFKNNNMYKNNSTLMINCNSLYNLHNHSNFPLSEKFSKSMDYLKIISRKGESKYGNNPVYKNHKESINYSYINEILNSTISSKKRKVLEKCYIETLQELGIFYKKVKKYTYHCVANFRDSNLKFKFSIVSVPNSKVLNRVNFVRLNCNLWDFYSLLKEINKNLNII